MARPPVRKSWGSESRGRTTPRWADHQGKGLPRADAAASGRDDPGGARPDALELPVAPSNGGSPPPRRATTTIHSTPREGNRVRTGGESPQKRINASRPTPGVPAVPCTIWRPAYHKGNGAQLGQDQPPGRRPRALPFSSAGKTALKTREGGAWFPLRPGRPPRTHIHTYTHTYIHRSTHT